MNCLPEFVILFGEGFGVDVDQVHQVLFFLQLSNLLDKYFYRNSAYSCSSFDFIGFSLRLDWLLRILLRLFVVVEVIFMRLALS